MINAKIGPREDYTNVLITIGKADGDSQEYPVVMDVTNWRVFPPCRLSLPATLLEGMKDTPQAFGMTLGKVLFDDAVLGKTYGETLAVCQGRGDGLRVRLRVEAEDLQGIAWERIYQKIDGEWHPLGTTAVTPFSRSVNPQQWARPVPVIQRPLKLLLVIASPGDLERANLDPIPEPERKKLRDLFGSLPDISVTVLESGNQAAPTLAEIRKELADGYQMIHFLCHGVKTNAGTALFLEKSGGLVDVVTTERLVSAIKAVQSAPVLCFLTACESAARARNDGFLPLGPALVEDGGVQAVVAMTSRVGFELASQFTSQFYTRLLKHGVLDLAVNEARALVRDQWDWGTPVLFSRLADNQLLDFPIGKIYTGYLAHNDRAYAAVDEAIAAARLEEHGQELVDNLLELVEELRKSHGALVSVAANFRRTGQDPETFTKSFSDFYYSFKEYYDQQTWVVEQTSCGRIGDLRSRILPRLAPILNDTAMDQLRQELEELSNSDSNLVRYFQDYLGMMNDAVEAIWAKLNDQKIEEAIQLKRDFEAQISPSFMRSKMMFERMGHSIRGVRAA
jgi:hypothetical protein